MKVSILIFSFIITLLYSFPNAIGGSQELLLKLLIKKGIITQQEAQEIMNEAKKEEAKKKQIVEVKKEDIIKEIKKNKDLFIPEPLKGLKFEVLSYIDYSNGNNTSDKSYNRFKLTRGYFTVKKAFTPWLHTRMTIDTHLDENGDYKERLKYLYLELRPKNFGFLTNIKSEIGLGHIPWLDFEEHVNPYRMQGTMAIERAGVFNSADVGASIGGYIGGRLKNAKKLTGNSHYAGKYGSWHIGLYNGAGYHDSERNNNKVIEGRLTLRPLSSFIPGLQLSCFGLYGEGNKETKGGDYPDYRANLFMLSYEHPALIFTGQYFRTKGNAKGTWVDNDGNALRTEGISFFADCRLPFIVYSAKRLHLFARYDYFDQDEDDRIAEDTAYRMYILGLAYDIYKGNKFILTFEKTNYEDDAGRKKELPSPNNHLNDEYRFQTVLQIKF